MKVVILVTYALLSYIPHVRASISPRTSCSLSYGGTTVQGTATASGGCRYTIRYAQATERWGYSSIVTDLSHQTTTSLPPSCPQDAGSYVDAAQQSEDCLFATVYTPGGTSTNFNLPVFVWIHGGSFTVGSASAPGLDGSHLAVSGHMIVVVLQYRLGILGYIPPALAPSSSDPNLGMIDVINGLKAVNLYATYFGGDKAKVTLGGQSSGAQMVRGVIGAPSAKGLFRAAILQSDPMTYGFSSPAITDELRKAFYAQSPMSGCSSLSCLQTLPIASLLSAQDSLVASAPNQITGAPLAEPIRPTFGTNTLPVDPTSLLFTSPSSLSSPASTLPILVTTVKNEAGSVTQQLFPAPIPIDNSTYYATLVGLVGSSRASAIFNSSYYPLAPSTKPYGPDGDEFRETFERLVTDGTWRCSIRDAARQWASAGGKVWVGEWRQGVTYPDNQVARGYCSTAGRVCHEDDIYPTFGTAPSAAAKTSALEAEITTYWTSFITTLNPNPSTTKRDSLSGSPDVEARSNVAIWKQYTASSTTGEVFSIGGDGLVSACPPVGFWGGMVKYDWQLYG